MERKINPQTGSPARFSDLSAAEETQLKAQATLRMPRPGKSPALGGLSGKSSTRTQTRPSPRRRAQGGEALADFSSDSIPFGEGAPHEFVKNNLEGH